MFRITRGISLDHAPAFNPALRYPDDAPLSIYGDADEAAADSSPSDPAEPSTPVEAPQPGASGESPSAETS